MLVLLSLCGLSAGASAQARRELDHLVFEAVLLDSATPEQPAVVRRPAPPANDEAAAAPGENPGVDTTEPPIIPETEPNGTDLAQQIQRYRDSIGALSASSRSTYSEALREQDYALALLLQQDGDHDGAIAVLDQAMQIDRVNHGLFTTHQIDVVERLIENHEALGDYPQVADLQEYLYYIQRKSYAEGDPRLAAATQRWADWNVDAYLRTGPDGRFGNALSYAGSSSGGRRYVAVQDPYDGRIYFVPRDKFYFAFDPIGLPDRRRPGAFSNLRHSPYVLLPDMLVDEHLSRARNLYDSLLAQQGTTLDPAQKAELQHKRANTDYLVKRQMDATIDDMATYSFGFNAWSTRGANVPLIARSYTSNADALEAHVKELEAAPDTDPATLAQAYVDLGDWHLSFERFQSANEAYRRAWELLGMPNSEAWGLHPILNPDYLVEVPAFVPHPYQREFYGLDRESPLEYRGYIDVTLGLGAQGQVRSPTITATSSDASPILRRALLDHLRDDRMRPFIQDGKPVGVDNLNLRFYYYY
ncbi:MAG TPA: hypothetical protein VNR18_12470 [Hyphomicrobiales bacterium]|nr:hypothetical protein [Hyphomicrobiales bacterium]